MTLLIPKLALPLFVFFCKPAQNIADDSNLKIAVMIPYGIMFGAELYKQYYGYTKDIEIKDTQGNIETKKYRVYESDPIGNILSILIPINFIFFLENQNVLIQVICVVAGLLGTIHDASILLDLKPFCTTAMEEIHSETNDGYYDGDLPITEESINSELF